MFDLLKKTVLTGIGIAALTKEKIEEFGKKLLKKESSRKKKVKNWLKIC